ncbi:retropepsin-like aspartic protease family protein [Rhodovulum adriaticum]|uniref:Aspartyl protease family protein n=1 Tax=Rhodovulum adriaticum TaxID=35804 RepID=A0A4R2NW30_RHOAD|nr:TIGR02281 family clan AA aspartic protease [Rhodovulum adriaticum]MBK1635669.1 TIGR02281 family clan AA aspartic protease [Rhodovulum adriaticum]TCP26177.1 aspartyl protease family protein [Rhodovulum adriaticum]
MTGDDFGSLIYLVLLGAAIGGYFLMENRNRLGKVAQQAAVWGLIFVGVIAGVGLWSDIRQTVAPRQAIFADQQRVEVPRAPDGHYYLTILVNDVPVRFVVDTGATDVVLTREDAARVGLNPDDLPYLGEARTANGRVSTARVRLEEMRLGPIVDSRVRAFVNGGVMDDSLLGMAYLNRFDRIEFAGDRMILTR